VKDERIPTASVIVVPIRTNHGHAIVDTGRSVSASDGTAALICFAKDDERHRRDAERHADDRVALPRPSPENSEKESAEESAVGKRRDREGDDDHRRFRVLREEQGATGQHHAPDQREDPADAQGLPVVGLTAR
jgi:hypothetical protein